MSEIINYTRLTTSDKVADKFLTCQIYVPQDKDQAELGEIFSHVEIKSPWFGATQVGQTIINTLIREYYRGHDSSELNNFEEAIKKVNESLAKSAQNGETEWIGKLSGVLILANNSEVHFAQTGKSHAYLYRGGRVNHITEGLEQEEAPHPLKTFSNLTSGSLQDNDKIVVANESFFEIISPNELSLIVSNLAPTAAALECAKIIQMHGVNDANAIFVELTTKENLADLPPDQKLEAVYLDHQVLGISTLSKNALTNIGSTISGLFKNGFRRLSAFISPLAKKGLEKSREGSKLALQKAREATSSRVEKLDNKVTNTSVSKSEDRFVDRLFGIIIKFFLKIKNKLRRNLIKTGIYGRKKSKMYAIFLIPVILILVAVITFAIYKKNNSKSQKDAETKHNQIILLEGEVSILISKKDTVGELDKLKNIISVADSLAGSKFAEAAKTSSQQASSKIIDITKLQSIKPESITKAEDSRAIEFDNQLLVLVGSNKFYYKTPNEANFSKGFDLGLGSDVAYSSTIIDATNIAVISKGKKLVKIDLNKNISSEINVEVKNTGLIESFSSNLYLLDNISPQIYKLTNNNGTFQAPSAYLKDKVDFSNLISFTIDGSIYTLTSGGEITRYSKGAMVGKISLDLPAAEKMKNYQIITTTESSDFLYMLANDGSNLRLIVIKKPGGFVKQFQLQDAKTPKDMVIDETNNKLFLLDENSLLTYKID